MKLFTTSEMENDGISGELRFHVRVDGEVDLSASSCEVPCVDDEEFVSVRMRVRVCRLELRASERLGTGGGGEVPANEENEERDE
jgi:hypothetical protein